MPESVSARVVTFLLNRGLDVESPLVTSDGCDTVNACFTSTDHCCTELDRRSETMRMESDRSTGLLRSFLVRFPSVQ